MTPDGYRPTYRPTSSRRRTIKRQQFQDGKRRDDAWAGYELRWPRPGYEIAREPDVGALEVVWKHRALVLGRDVGTRVAWPPGGVFWPRADQKTRGHRTTRSRRQQDPWPLYDPVAVAERILLDVQRTETENPKALLKFVNDWGCSEWASPVRRTSRATGCS